MARTLERMKGRRDGGLFVPIPLDVLTSENFRTLSPSATKLLLALMSQLRMSKGGPKNNGDLSAAFSNLKAYGFGSPVTVTRARRQLVDRGFIFETRKGFFPSTCTLFAITFFSLNDCNGKLDVTPQAFPRAAWRLWKATTNGAALNTESDARAANTNTESDARAKATARTKTESVFVGRYCREPQLHNVYTF